MSASAAELGGTGARRRALEDVARPFTAARNWVVQKRGVAAAMH